MDVNEAIRQRKSIRAFQDRDVPSHLIDEMLKAAVCAPSEGNLQPWRFFVVRDVRTKKKLGGAAFNQMFVAEAPVVIVVCINVRATEPYGRRGKELYSIQSTAAAVENMLLTAVSLDLGTCWVGAFREDDVTTVLDLDPEVRPVALIPVGYCAENPPHRRRIPVEDVTVYVE